MHLQPCSLHHTAIPLDPFFSHLALQILMQSLELAHIRFLHRPTDPETLLLVWFGYHMEMYLKSAREHH